MMRHWHFIVIFLVLLHFACGGGAPPPFRSQVDGDRPLHLYLTDKARAFAADTGSPAGARLRMLEAALPRVASTWNPEATGPAQDIPVDWDQATDGPCVMLGTPLWSTPGEPDIYLQQRWIQCVDEDAKDLYGPTGCFLHLLHELAHVLGARKHAPQNGRMLHGGGPVLCNWVSDCQDATLTDYTTEDVALICNDGGHGGRC